VGLQPAPWLSIGGYPIALSKHLRYLGVILDSRLSFGKHVEKVSNEADAFLLAGTPPIDLIAADRDRIKVSQDPLPG